MFCSTNLRKKKQVEEDETQVIRVKQWEGRKENRLTVLPQMLAEALTPIMPTGLMCSNFLPPQERCSCPREVLSLHCQGNAASDKTRCVAQPEYLVQMERMGFRLLPAMPQESNGGVTDGRGHWDKLRQWGDQETAKCAYLRILRITRVLSVQNSLAALLWLGWEITKSNTTCMAKSHLRQWDLP